MWRQTKQAAIWGFGFLVVFQTGRVALADVQAIAGKPFGVARITVPFPAEDVGSPLQGSGFRVDQAQRRVFYPAFSEGVFKQLLGDAAPPPTMLTVYFLFRGDRPFDVNIRTPTVQTVHVQPHAMPPRRRDLLLRRWWRYYHRANRAQARRSDYPPIVETYLTATLSRRLGLATPVIDQFLRVRDQISPGSQTLSLLAGTESLRIETLRATCLGLTGSGEEAKLQVPPDVAWRQPAIPTVDHVNIEPLAQHVPEECFYVRFGSFSNYLWCTALLEEYGGDIGSMVTARSLQVDLMEQTQRQLCVKQTELAKIVGPSVISDVALIGRDTYTREGAAVGILFQARNQLLGVDLDRQQREAWAKEKDRGATREVIKIAGHDVSFVSTPDNRLRSFYVVDGDFHLVTTSRAIVGRFLEAGQGKGPLATNSVFRYARSLYPLDRADTVFAFFSPAFFEGLLSAQYQIEQTRRLRSVTDIELIKLARLAARGEGVRAETPEQLIQAGLLPRGFGRRPDGSGPIVTDLAIIDSMRGARGTFVPIPDVRLKAVTAAEQQWFMNRAAYLAENWQQLDPVILALGHSAKDTHGLERLRIDVHVAPLDETKYGPYLSVLGKPTRRCVARPADSMIFVQAALRGGLISSEIPPHTMVLGVQDHVPLIATDSTSILNLLQILRAAPGYLAAWPQPGFLDLLPLGLGGQPDAQGVTRLLFGVLRWQGSDFSIVSRDHAILSHTAKQLQPAMTDDPAQVRVHVGDLNKAKFVDWLDAMYYERTRQTSVGNARLLSLLTQQLGVPPADALMVANDLLDATLVCPLGGKYELVEQSGSHAWTSTAWPPNRRYQLPPGYRAKPLTWFRGLEAELLKHPGGVAIHAEMDMQRKQPKAMFRLPWASLLGGDK